MSRRWMLALLLTGLWGLATEAAPTRRALAQAPKALTNPQDLVWDFEGAGHTSFQVWRCTSPSADECLPTAPLPAAIALGPTVRQFQDATAEEGVRYCYASFTVYGATRSGPSNIICTTVPVTFFAPPTNFRLEP